MIEEVAIAIGYVGAAIGTARGQFTYLRNLEIEDQYRRKVVWKDPEKAIEEAKKGADEYNSINMLPAIAMGITWPISVPLVFGTRGLQKWFMKNPGKSKSELEVEHLVMQERIKELEKELGIHG